MSNTITRKKATPEQCPGIGPVSIVDAHKELSQEAFASWIRFMVSSDQELKAGRNAIAAMLGFKQRRGNEVLRELYLKGYISFDTHPGRFTYVAIQRRAMISARANFVRLSSMDVHGVEARAGVTFVHVGKPTKAVAAGLTWPSAGLTQGESWTYLGHQPDFPKGTIASDSESGGFGGRPGVLLASVEASKTPPKFPDVDGVSKRKFVAESTYKAPPPESTKRGIDLSRLKAEKGRLKDRRHVERSETATNHSVAAKTQGRRPGSIDWLALDKYDDPILSFDPEHPRHALFIRIIDRPKNDKSRQALVAKIATEFCRIYTRYRREAERRRRASSDYNVPDEERRYAMEAGVMCLRKGVTPRQLLEYWDQHIGNFADRTMVIPPLSFLKAPANIDRVACSTLTPAAFPGGKPSYGKTPVDTTRPAAGHSYANLEGLDPRLRPSLEKAGIKTQAFNDRFLLTVQHNAILLAKGTKVYMAAGKLKQMAEHAAVVLYAD